MALRCIVCGTPCAPIELREDDIRKAADSFNRAQSSYDPVAVSRAMVEYFAKRGIIYVPSSRE